MIKCDEMKCKKKHLMLQIVLQILIITMDSFLELLLLEFADLEK